MKTPFKRDTATACGDCGMIVRHAAQYHPFLHCELFKLGHDDPDAYLKQYGYRREGPFDNFGHQVSK